MSALVGMQMTLPLHEQRNQPSLCLQGLLVHLVLQNGDQNLTHPEEDGGLGVLQGLALAIVAVEGLEQLVVEGVEGVEGGGERDLEEGEAEQGHLLQTVQ